MGNLKLMKSSLSLVQLLHLICWWLPHLALAFLFVFRSGLKLYMFLVWWLSSARTQLDSLLMMTDIASIFFMTQQLSHAIAFKEVQSWASQFHRLSLSYWMLDRFCLLVELPISQGLAWHCACRIYVCAVQCRDHLTCNSNWFVTVANLFFFFHQFIFLEFC